MEALMLLVDNYFYLPGCCWMCRSINTPTIDTGIDLDHFNSPDDVNPSANSRFYICADCAMEMARMVSTSRNIEFVTAGTVAGLNESNQVIADSNIKLTERIEELESALRVVNSIPAAPKESPAKKSFKVAAPDEDKI
jgi:hypothetical protein